MAGGGGNKIRFQFCTDSSRAILYLRALQGHSGRNLIEFWTAGQCIYSEQFLRVHLSHRMCNLLTLHHEFRIDTGICGSYEQRTQRSEQNWPGSTASCMVPSEKVEGTSKTRCIGSTSYLLKRKGLSSIKHDRTQSSFTTHSSLLYPEGYHDGNWRNHIRESICVTSTPPKISFKDNWREELGSEIAGGSGDSQQTQPKTKKPIVRTVRPVERWATIWFAYSGNRQRCIAWMRKHQCKHGETCEQFVCQWNGKIKTKTQTKK